MRTEPRRDYRAQLRVLAQQKIPIRTDVVVLGGSDDRVISFLLLIGVSVVALITSTFALLDLPVAAIAYSIVANGLLVGLCSFRLYREFEGRRSEEAYIANWDHHTIEHQERILAAAQGCSVEALRDAVQSTL